MEVCRIERRQTRDHIRFKEKRQLGSTEYQRIGFTLLAPPREEIEESLAMMPTVARRLSGKVVQRLHAGRRFQKRPLH